MLSKQNQCTKLRSNFKHKSTVVPEFCNVSLIASVEKYWSIVLAVPPFVCNSRDQQWILNSEFYKTAKSEWTWSLFFCKVEESSIRGHRWKLMKNSCCCDTHLQVHSSIVRIGQATQGAKDTELSMLKASTARCQRRRGGEEQGLSLIHISEPTRPY